MEAKPGRSCGSRIRGLQALREVPTQLRSSRELPASPSAHVLSSYSASCCVEQPLPTPNTPASLSSPALLLQSYKPGKSQVKTHKRKQSQKGTIKLDKNNPNKNKIQKHIKPDVGRVVEKCSFVAKLLSLSEEPQLGRNTQKNRNRN